MSDGSRRRILRGLTIRMDRKGIVTMRVRSLDVIDGSGRGDEEANDCQLWVVPRAWIVVLWSLPAIFRDREFTSADVLAEVKNGRTAVLRDALGDLIHHREALDAFLAELIGESVGGGVLRSRAAQGTTIYRFDSGCSR